MADPLIEGRDDTDGDRLVFDVGKAEIEGFSEGCPLGILDTDGFIEGEPPLGWDDGCDVGQSEPEGFSDG